MDLNSPGVTHPFGFTRAPRWAPGIGDCEWNDTKTRHTHKRQTPTTPSRWKRTAKACGFILYIAPLAEFQIAWLSLFSTAQVHKCYHTAKGSEIHVYCRACPEPFLFPYHRKGMFPRLQGTTKLKAVSRLLGRTPCLQAHSARAESPVCRHISLPYCGCINPLVCNM